MRLGVSAQCEIASLRRRLPFAQARPDARKSPSSMTAQDSLLLKTSLSTVFSVVQHFR